MGPRSGSRINFIKKKTKKGEKTNKKEIWSIPASLSSLPALAVASILLKKKQKKRNKQKRDLVNTCIFVFTPRSGSRINFIKKKTKKEEQTKKRSGQYLHLCLHSPLWQSHQFY